MFLYPGWESIQSRSEGLIGGNEEMNLDVRAGRNWRRSRKKGVSPIIATILLVAITVVLAAVLYVLISGLTKGPGNTPLGSAFAWGTSANVTASTPTGCVAAKECYNIEIASASSGLLANSLTFTARTSAGAVQSMTGWTIVLITVGGTNASAMWQPASGTNTACVGSGCTTVLAGGQAFILNTHGTAGLSGVTLIAVGGGSFAGTVQMSSGLPP